MVRKPTSGDSEQREHEAERARRSSQLSAGGADQLEHLKKQSEKSHKSRSPRHGSSDGESAHGALPRSGIEFEQGDD
ncbi:MAG TPA: hypothetical protein VF021_10615 [Longimicrobiales bacterium]